MNSVDSSPKGEVVHETKFIQHIPFNTCLDGHIGKASDFKAVMVAVGRSNPTGGNFLVN